MALHPKGKNAVGIGHCDKCDIRIFADESYYLIDGQVLCEDCLEELDEDDDTEGC